MFYVYWVNFLSANCDSATAEFNSASLLQNLPAPCRVALRPHNTALGVDEPLRYWGLTAELGRNQLQPWRNPFYTTGMHVPDNDIQAQVVCLCFRREKNQCCPQSVPCNRRWHCQTDLVVRTRAPGYGGQHNHRV